MLPVSFNVVLVPNFTTKICHETFMLLQNSLSAQSLNWLINQNCLGITSFAIVLPFRACPECRVASDFVCPSTYWVDTQEEKAKLIEEYKAALNAKDCKYYKKVNWFYLLVFFSILFSMEFSINSWCREVVLVHLATNASTNTPIAMESWWIWVLRVVATFNLVPIPTKWKFCR